MNDTIHDLQQLSSSDEDCLSKDQITRARAIAILWFPNSLQFMSPRSRKSYSSIFKTVHISTLVKIQLFYSEFTKEFCMQTNGHSKIFSGLEINENCFSLKFQNQPLSFLSSSTMWPTPKRIIRANNNVQYGKCSVPVLIKNKHSQKL